MKPEDIRKLRSLETRPGGRAKSLVYSHPTVPWDTIVIIDGPAAHWSSFTGLSMRLRPSPSGVWPLGNDYKERFGRAW